MVWNVMVRPMAGFEAFVRLFTEMIVTVFGKNFKVNLEEGSDERRRVDRDGVWVVRSDSWVGRVMVTRSLDRRGVGERAGVGSPAVEVGGNIRQRWERRSRSRVVGQ